VLVGETAKTYANMTGVRFEDVGPIQVKGVEQPVQVHRAVKDKT
jgi:class 3 adenylate cyclase